MQIGYEYHIECRITSIRWHSLCIAATVFIVDLFWTRAPHKPFLTNGICVWLFYRYPCWLINDTFLLFCHISFGSWHLRKTKLLAHQIKCCINKLVIGITFIAVVDIFRKRTVGFFCVWFCVYNLQYDRPLCIAAPVCQSTAS